MAETNARQVADYVVSFLAQHGDLISNLKLQKLLYYSQAWYLALYDKPLFGQRIEAWTHGPAIPPVYGEFKKWAWNPIPPPDKIRALPQRPESHVKEVIEVYGSFSAYQLERLTHQEDPWKNARIGLSPDEPSHNIIKLEDMKMFYRARLNVKHKSR
jgi:uncharacterized phage-associated protein